MACYGCWRWLAYLVAQETAARRTILRYWWPTAMLGWSWSMLWSASFPGASRWLGFARDPLFIAFFGVNLPQAVIGNALLGILIDKPAAIQGGVASAVVWLLWYGVIRVWQWRRESNQDRPRVVP